MATTAKKQNIHVWGFMYILIYMAVSKFDDILYSSTIVLSRLFIFCVVHDFLYLNGSYKL